jgi:DNA-binding transcriptional LysR family regulator
MKLEGIATFVTVAESGSLSEAARRLRVSRSVASERLVELERSLGASLLQRSTRKVSLTEAARSSRAPHASCTTCRRLRPTWPSGAGN